MLYLYQQDTCTGIYSEHIHLLFIVCVGEKNKNLKGSTIETGYWYICDDEISNFRYEVLICE